MDDEERRRASFRPMAWGAFTMFVVLLTNLSPLANGGRMGPVRMALVVISGVLFVIALVGSIRTRPRH